MPVLDRARAHLGAALSGLQRSPWFPDAVRTRSYSIFGGELGLRLPHAICGAALVGIAIAWARARGSSIAASLTGGAIAMSLPVLVTSSRTALGNPVGELMIVLVAIAGHRALRCTTIGCAAAWATFGALALALSIASLGIVLGGTIPLAVLAVLEAEAQPKRRVPTIVLATAAVGTLALGTWLALAQQDGYIPILGAAKDLELMDKPQTRRFAAALEDFGYQSFPWAGLLLVGAVLPRARIAALWIVIAIAIAGGWSLVYGRVPMPIVVPAALLGAAAVEALGDGNRSVWERRLMVFVIAAGALVLRRDAELRPSLFSTPSEVWEGEHNFPAKEVKAAERLRSGAGWVLLAVFVSALVGRRRSERGLERWLQRVPASWREGVAVGVFGLAALASSITLARGLVPSIGHATSPREPLRRFQAWVDAGELSGKLGIHRIRDDAVALYGPGDLEVLQSRRDVPAFLMVEEPRAAVVRDADFAPTMQQARQQGWPIYVLDASHARYRLIANVLPTGAEDVNPLHAVLFDEPPVLANETRLAFENYVEIIGWEIEQPLVRGSKRTLQLVFKVLRPLPAGSKLYHRFMSGKLSRINREAVTIADDVYPTNLWREGDYILHRYEFEVPALESIPGEYELIIGLRRTETKNYTITVPEGETGEFGVVVTDKKNREFARIGTVELW
jgi:hypothetical protein